MSRKELEEFLSSLTRAEIDDRLSKLTVSQAKVLYEKFDDKPNPLIGNLLGGKSVGWVEGEVRKAYKKLGIDTQQVHSSETSSLLNTYFRESFMEWIDNKYENIDFRFPENEPEEETAFDSEPDVDENEKIKAKGNDIKADKADSQATAPQSSRRRWTVPILIIVFILIAFGAFILGRILPAGLAEITSSPSPTEQQVQITDTTVPQPTKTEIVSQPIVPTLTDTVLPPTPTSPSPTSTLTPTETSTPRPPALFETSFDSGMPDGMEMVYGDIDFVDGELLAHELTLLSIGEDTWKNYQVEYETRKHTYCWGIKNNGIAAHATDPENMIVWSWNYCETGWFEMVSGDWVKITGGRDIVANPGTVVKIRLVAENGNFTVYTNNIKRTSYYDEKYTQGKVYIVINNTSVIDNIYISLLP